MILSRQQKAGTAPDPVFRRALEAEILQRRAAIHRSRACMLAVPLTLRTGEVELLELVKAATSIDDFEMTQDVSKSVWLGHPFCRPLHSVFICRYEKAARADHGVFLRACPFVAEFFRTVADSENAYDGNAAIFRGCGDAKVAPLAESEEGTVRVQS